MRYVIKGAHRETGEDMTVTVDAPTPSAAKNTAGRLGLMVERIDLEANPASPLSEPVKVEAASGVQTIEKTSKRLKLQMV